ncbi:ABC transporter substrate-binding protein [Nocardioides eburneiflavus]|uniref:ABC transporter substrate-binding protein n=1 Tax=Nocardioides eburneiflavus TaxID=2518372 RepID=A0A4Z1CJL8_9ACTN|nr:ABC transporter substrate-binding protein [Nocardioides eburneiflavus]TGN64193.1 ABC transporter substrate-binding protein [Nocardioides eburneiflavus]
MTIRTKAPLALAIGAALLSVAACGGGGDPLATGSDEGGGSDTIVVGSADFTESALLAEIYAGALEAQGVQVEKTLNIGSREAYIPALQDGSIDLIPEYTGVLAHYFDEDATATESEAVYEELQAALPESLAVLDKAEAEDKDAIAVTRETAEEHSLVSIADLAAVAGDLTLGAGPEWKTRASGVPGLAEVYGAEFESFRALDAGGPLTVQALKNGQVDAANLFTTDPNIAANDFVVLEDPENLFAAENVVPLITRSKLDDTISETLNEVSANLDTATLAALLERVVMDKEDAGDVAADFLSEHGLA